mmetsp:Transcript_17592/g.38183  ORF Transcript_17592/g.38183 Transcript_17592/m.38183 type:complete len:85 (+) Transcript_17592:2625-2879(+)
MRAALFVRQKRMLWGGAEEVELIVRVLWPGPFASPQGPSATADVRRAREKSWDRKDGAGWNTTQLLNPKSNVWTASTNIRQQRA